MDSQAPSAPLDQRKISQNISSYWRVSVVELTGSTQDDLLKRVESLNAENGDVLIANYQSSGRGRLDRTFSAPSGSALLFSLYFKPTREKSEWGIVNLIAGISVCDVLNALLEKPVTLKWPNDLLVDGKKISGLIAQATTDGIVLGIGINIGMTQSELPVSAATSLALEGGLDLDRNEICALVLKALEENFKRFEAGEDFVEIYTHLSSTIGKKVRVELPGGREIESMALGIDATGALVLADGSHISAGDVIHLR
jgi:BirA family biotin operon repressor/biotin-[acetyl-CoA-carboxylase] ligase